MGTGLLQGVMNAVIAMVTHNAGCVRQSKRVNSVSIKLFCFHKAAFKRKVSSANRASITQFGKDCSEWLCRLYLGSENGPLADS